MSSDVLASLQAPAALGALDIGSRLDVDTSGPVSIDNVVREIRDMFTRCLTRGTQEGSSWHR